LEEVSGEGVRGRKGGKGRGKGEMPALSAFHRNSVVDLHRVSVPHYDDVRRHSLDSVFHNLGAVKPISLPLATTPLMEQSKFTYTP